MPPPDTITRAAHAKVNLALSVGPPMPEGEPRAGWHPICSWMHAIDLADEVAISRAQSTSYDIAWADGSPVDWNLDNDLCVRAHRVLEAHAERPLPARIRVTKRIPAGGGLGGGSSDAAATLLALNEVFGLGLTDLELQQVSCPLGSDIAYFIQSRPSGRMEIESSLSGHEPGPPAPAIVSRFGDRIDRVARTTSDLVLVLPPFGCSTPEVYAAYDATPNALDEPRVRALAADGLRDSSVLFNDLAAPACRVAPALAELIERIASVINAPVHVSGSGSTLFVVKGNADEIAACAPECRVVRTRLV